MAGPNHSTLALVAGANDQPRLPPATSRRGMLTAAASALLAGAAIATAAHGAPVAPPAGVGDDAALSPLLATLKAHNSRIRSIVDEAQHLPEGVTPASRDQERRLEEAMDEWWGTAEAIFESPATTPAAIRAKGDALQIVLLDMLRPGDRGYTDPAEHEDCRLRFA